MKRPRVLLVDDMPEIVEYCTEILKTDCDIVGQRGERERCLGAYAATAPDVIVLDISMPGLDRIEVAKRLRRAGSGAAIVFFSADHALVTAALEAGGSAYVSKTLVASALRVAIFG